RRARGRGHDRARRGAAHPALQRQDLLRAPRRAPRARHRLRGARARRAALPLPGEGARGHLRRLPRSASGVLGAGGAVEHGRVARIEEDGGARAAAPAAPKPAPAAPETPNPAPAMPAAPRAPAEAEAEPVAARGVGPLSPAVRRLLAEHDLDPTLVPASGKGG